MASSDITVADAMLAYVNSMTLPVVAEENEANTAEKQEESTWPVPPMLPQRWVQDQEQPQRWVQQAEEDAANAELNSAANSSGEDEISTNVTGIRNLMEDVSEATIMRVTKTKLEYKRLPLNITHASMSQNGDLFALVNVVQQKNELTETSKLVSSQLFAGVMNQKEALWPLMCVHEGVISGVVVIDNIICVWFNKPELSAEFFWCQDAGALCQRFQLLGLPELAITSSVMNKGVIGDCPAALSASQTCTVDTLWRLLSAFRLHCANVPVRQIVHKRGNFVLTGPGEIMGVSTATPQNVWHWRVPEIVNSVDIQTLGDTDRLKSVVVSWNGAAREIDFAEQHSKSSSSLQNITLPEDMGTKIPQQCRVLKTKSSSSTGLFFRRGFTMIHANTLSKTGAAVYKQKRIQMYQPIVETVATSSSDIVVFTKDGLISVYDMVGVRKSCWGPHYMHTSLAMCPTWNQAALKQILEENPRRCLLCPIPITKTVQQLLDFANPKPQTTSTFKNDDDKKCNRFHFGAEGQVAYNSIHAAVIDGPHSETMDRFMKAREEADRRHEEWICKQRPWWFNEECKEQSRAKGICVDAPCPAEPPRKESHPVCRLVEAPAPAQASGSVPWTPTTPVVAEAPTTKATGNADHTETPKEQASSVSCMSLLGSVFAWSSVMGSMFGVAKKEQNELPATVPATPIPTTTTTPTATAPTTTTNTSDNDASMRLSVPNSGACEPGCQQPRSRRHGTMSYEVDDWSLSFFEPHIFASQPAVGQGLTVCKVEKYDPKASKVEQMRNLLGITREDFASDDLDELMVFYMAKTKGLKTNTAIPAPAFD